MRLLAPFLLLVAALIVTISLDRTPTEADLVFVNRGDVFTLDPQRQSYLQDFRMTYALYEGLRMVAEEGLETRWTRHLHHHRALRAGLEALGLAYIPSHSLPNLNAVRVPDGVEDALVRRRLLDEPSFRGCQRTASGPSASTAASWIARLGSMPPFSTR